MKRFVFLTLAAAVVLAVPASHLVFGKGHVRLGKVQVCHKGTVLAVSENALGGHMRHGDCQLPACDSNNVFMQGDSCSNAGAADGKCALANPRAAAVTDACPPGTY